MPTKLDQPFSPVLLEALKTNPRIKSLMEVIQLEAITPADKPLIDELDRAVTNYLKAEPALMQEWRDSSDLVGSILKWGFPTDSRVIAAAILSGAAISLPGVTLRNDVHPSLQEARKAYQHCLDNGIDPKSPGSRVLELHPNIVTSPLTPDKPSVVNELADAFSTLMQGPTLLDGFMGRQKSSIDTFGRAIKDLLEDGNKPLRVGVGLHTLDLNAIDQELGRRFRQGYSSRVDRIPIGDDLQKARLSYAREESTLRLSTSRCIRRQEDSNDELFWVVYHYSLKNLAEVYDQIDAAMQRGSLGDISLNFEWQVKAWQSPLFGGINENAAPLQLNAEIGKAAIHKGFGPWTASLVCIENDDHEYDAISETANTIGDYAKAISLASSTVAAVSGPSPMAVGAAALASVANYVALCCDVTEAVVDIVNFFDEDDVIGFTSFTGRGDYAQDRPVVMRPPQTFEVQAFPARQVGNRSRGGCYEICASEILKGTAQFERTWRFRQFPAEGRKYHKEPDWWVAGCSGEVQVDIALPEPANMLAPGLPNITTDPPPGSKNAHAEWVKGPQLMGDHVHVTGEVHYGTKGHHDIDFTPWVVAWAFTKPQDERFSIN